MSRRSAGGAASWLAAQMAAGNGSLELSLIDIQATNTDWATLQDGRRSFDPAAYYADYRTPRSLRSLHVVASVPTAAHATDPTAGNVLREDLQLADLVADIEPLAGRHGATALRAATQAALVRLGAPSASTD